MRRNVAVLVLSGLLGCGAAGAYQSEILRLDGTAHIQKANGIEAPAVQGDLLEDGDKLKTDENSFADLAFDGEWNNTVRVEPGTSIKVEKAFPTTLDLERGGVYVKLKKLPAGSAFEVRTPTAVAAARGTEYRTLFKDGQTEILNFSESLVYVYPVASGGVRGASPRVLTQAKKISVSESVPAEAPAQSITEDDKSQAESLQKEIELSAQLAVDEGRIAKIETVDELEKSLVPQALAVEATPDEDSEDKQEKKEVQHEDMHLDAFAADMVMTGAQGSVKARVHISPGKTRMEMGPSVSIVRLDRGVVWVMMPGQNMYIEQGISPEMAAQAASGEGAILSRVSLGADTVDNRPAEKFEVRMLANGQEQTIIQWMVKGIPVPVKLAGADGSWSVVYSNINLGAQPDALFEVPDGYSKMDMPTLPQTAGGVNDLENLLKQQGQ